MPISPQFFHVPNFSKKVIGTNFQLGLNYLLDWLLSFFGGTWERNKLPAYLVAYANTRNFSANWAGTHTRPGEYC